MAQYSVYEGNLEKLEKKIATIENKCKKYNVAFHYEKVGEEIRTVKDEDDNNIKVKFIIIDLEGAMKHQDWEFIAKVDHYDDGNIIRQFNTEIEVPERYHSTAPICEHCQTSRHRKFTYLVHNKETDEWKQVGASCLKEFTCGLDAEYVARYISLFDYVIEGEKGCYNGIRWEPQFDLENYLCYVKWTVDKFGYISNSAAYESCGSIESTSGRAWDYFAVCNLHRTFGYSKTIEEIEGMGLTDSIACSDGNVEYVRSALEWIRNDESTEGFMFNLRIACLGESFPLRNKGFVTSLMPTYYRHLKNLEYEAKKKKEQGKGEISQYQGEVKQRITFSVADIECVWSGDNYFGMYYLYKITDNDGNIYMWSTSKSFEEGQEVNSITGTVKSHEEFRGVKQTHLTRCKVA